MNKPSNHLAVNCPVILTKIPLVNGQTYDFALNASIVLHNGKYYCCYRVEKFPFFTAPSLVFANYDPVKKYTYNDRPLNLSTVPYAWISSFQNIVKNPECHHEDPRLLSAGDQGLLLVFTDGFNMFSTILSPEDEDDIITSGDLLYPMKPPPYFRVPKPVGCDTREKNWTPFMVNNEIRFIYSFSPFVVMDQHGIISDYSKNSVEWYTSQYGMIRGGTPSIPFKDPLWITFTHSSIATNEGRCYFMGFAIHDSDELLFINRTPLLSTSFPRVGRMNIPSDHAVVFPSGVIQTNTGWDVSFGHNDRENRIVSVTLEEVEWLKEPVRLFNERERSILGISWQ
jgi:predicted GH43/DUF377 family glycosyl hydrolase